MLSSETKRKIDSARDILVGKVPDPKAQVEQITTALIYKFMDDMDKEAQEIGGKARFFTNGYEKYAWTKLMDPKLGGHDRLDLYVESLTQLSLNSHIPQLFRDIFKDAFLPYRNPETLSLFIKEINGFSYVHSEDLGDAFEYLLSILGSQGDAGQFRTPRHIIDFIVAAVDPKKDDVICDPACGTAGFLISAYKHILKQHDGKDDPKNKEKPLTPDDKKQMMNHFVGYDISPDMVKLSKVNMYLHGFPEPKIYECDTLSSEERWDDSFDVMLANPPFMTPKGGIKPHKRFSVQANRAEVLFVDYIKEHLRPNGRAGIIVPEGIIFQSGIAYKQLRKLLVEDGLFAVVSLPAGVFNPYSGVKTSILFLDNQLAKKSDSILFIKIDNDGYGLGAQRREIDKNDLPLALTLINSYKRNIASKNFPQTDKLETLTKNTISIFVPKSKISDLGDYYLTGDRYREINVQNNQKWPMVELGEYCDLVNGYAFKSDNYVDKGIRVVRITNVQKGEIVDDNPKFYSSDTKEPIEKYRLFEGDLLISLTGNVGRVGLLSKELLPAALNQRVACLRIKNDKINLKFLFFLLNKDGFEQMCIKASSGVAQKNLSTFWLSKYKIPLPPIEIQKKVINEIENYQKIIDLASEMIQVKGINISFDQSWQKISLNDLAVVRYGYTASAKDEGDARFVRITDIDEYGELISDNQKFITLDKESRSYLLKKNDVLVARTGATFGKTMIFKEDYPAVFASYLIRLQFDESKILPEYYWCFSQTKDYWDQAQSLVTGGGQPQFNGNVLKNILVPLPPLDKQKDIAEEFLKIRNQLVNQNLGLIGIFKERIQRVIEKI